MSSDDGPADKKVGRSYWDFLFGLLMFFVFLVIGLPVALALAYVITGISSVGYYGPPVEEVMDFFSKSATLLATVATPLVALLALLYGIKPLRKYIDRFLERFSRSEPSKSS